MNILFLSLYNFKSINDGYICADLVKCFKENGHNLVVVSPQEKGEYKLNKSEGIDHINIHSGPIQKTSAIKKVLNLMKLDKLTIKEIKKNYANIKFDLVITMISHCAFIKTAKFVKCRDNAFIYNMVKDIFPQNAVDMGMMKKGGLIYKYFRGKEKKYYKLSSCLGVLSPKALEILSHDAKSLSVPIEVNPNTIIAKDFILSDEERKNIREKYSLPREFSIAIYGGNLGKPQGIDFLLDIIKENETIDNELFYLIIGDGTEFSLIEEFFKVNNIKKALLLKRVPHRDFCELVASSDMALVFLDKRFTVPNFPSRVLAYMEARLPVIFAVDNSCDAGIIAEKNNWGFNCLNGDIKKFNEIMQYLLINQDKIKEMGENSFNFLKENYSVEISYNKIMSHLKENNNV